MTGWSGAKVPSAICGALLCVSCGDPVAANSAAPTDKIEQMLIEQDASTADVARCRYLRHRDRKIWGCVHELPIGPRASGAGLTDSGICGITKVIGNADESSVLRILVGPGGRYRLLLGVGDRTSHRLDVRVSCASITGFSGLPSAATLTAARDYSVGSHDRPRPGETLTFRKIAAHGGEPADLCLWSGFEGNVNSVPLGDLNSFLFSGTRYDAEFGWSLDAITFGSASHDFTSYSRCDGYFPAHGWNYLYALQSWSSHDFRGVFSQYPYADAELLPVDASTHFCWLTGISTYGPRMQADLHVVTPAGSAPRWRYEGLTTSTMVGIQCVPYRQ